jgi:pyrimidine operon attenuation protein/uracil phosphoribosyltransferase
MSNDKLVLDGDDMRRTLVRIAHEIVEKNPEHDRLAIVGIHRRGALLARRLHELLTDLLETDVPLGELDISFYRDDLGRRAEAPDRPLHLSSTSRSTGPRS